MRKQNSAVKLVPAPSSSQKSSGSILGSQMIDHKIPAKKIKLGKPGSIGTQLMQNGPGPLKVTRIPTASKSSSKKESVQEPEQRQSMYGLDMELLKQLNIETD
jgi:hypothetical protein